MKQFLKGQRWVSEMEPELGLGILMDVDVRTVRIQFRTSQCVRQYAMSSAPLKRVTFSPGDRVMLRDQTTITIESITEEENLFYYHGEDRTVCEDELSDAMVFTNPQERLNAGFVDSPELFDLRYQAHLARYHYRKSDIMGFTGARVDLIPHQFYIAGEVASRHIPRVLLADETGLGKTIEACLILNRLLLSEQIHRVLILLPHSLVHQWFVELYRRFHLTFRIVDQDHCASLEAQDGSVNPFLEDQLILCDMNYVVFNEQRRAQCIAAGWDMVVVDEAHHVDEKSPAYSFLKQAAPSETALMLLTATPEQLGVERHFAHLKLMDPLRYTTLKCYLKEAERYREIAGTMDQAMDDIAVARGKSGQGKQGLEGEESIERLLDCYGPGRAVFRNTRMVIKGFPRRKGVLHPLDESDSPPPVITDSGCRIVEDCELTHVRIQWLIDLLKCHSNEKFLLICHRANKTIEIADALKRRINLKIALFHENMTILQRDRNAAWFSEKNGADLMICSEIGSEGRNFQFACHLVMFDLPLNPELLEQRIGRLDRIGQTRDIEIHLPFAKGTVQEILVRWYQDGTGIFEKNISGIHYICKTFEQKLNRLFQQCMEEHRVPENSLKTLICETREFSEKIAQTLFRGKDRLLELNSFRPEPAHELIQAVNAVDEDHNFDTFVLQLFDYFGIKVEDTLARSFRLHVSDPENSDIPLPALKKNGMHITFDRKTAVTRDDMEFLSWDHPMVSGSMDLLLGSEQGNSAMAELQSTGKFAILLESVHVIECVAPKYLNINRFLPSVPIRTVVNHAMEDLTEHYTVESLKVCSNIASAWMNDFPEIKESLLPRLIETSHSRAREQADLFIEKAGQQVRDRAAAETARLVELKKKNPAVRDDEITWIAKEAELYLKYLSTAALRLDALRLIRVA